ncbi:class I SAM-dependent methyltransferase [Ottowia testudinis]|uniref:Methyltransferase domain-containing protein n=1 Tax=Ottowia testudinis TaxID=2816950 RepID=A0A975CHA4_9BURK|nr:methyltransferase domain-containing protein [Ottowia testudinis]QTD45762.1 methyltransferase domain-containing protein [Ottowia testudinis]
MTLPSYKININRQKYNLYRNPNQEPKTREQKILRYINLSMRGIEIAPYHNPLAPKAKGYNCLTLDVFDFDRLKENAKNDPNVKDKIDLIEPVDIVTSATELDIAIERRGELGTFDYIISSHNFEHLPNPIRFLLACGRTLKPGGILSMAIPNKRFTFDYARSLSRFIDVFRAFHENHIKPDLWTLFDFNASFAENVPTTPQHPGTPKYANQVTDAFSDLKKRLASDAPQDYMDAHVWVFTPESFTSIMLDCMILGLIPLSLVQIEEAGFEFYAHFKNTNNIPKEDITKLESLRKPRAAITANS